MNHFLIVAKLCQSILIHICVWHKLLTMATINQSFRTLFASIVIVYDRICLCGRESARVCRVQSWAQVNRPDVNSEY